MDGHSVFTLLAAPVQSNATIYDRCAIKSTMSMMFIIEVIVDTILFLVMNVNGIDKNNYNLINVYLNLNISVNIGKG